MNSLTEVESGVAAAHRREIFCSIIIPVYDEEENLIPLHERITEAMGQYGATYGFPSATRHSIHCSAARYWSTRENRGGPWQR